MLENHNIEALRDENETLFFMIQDMLNITNQKQQEINNLDYEKSEFFVEPIENYSQLFAIAWIYSMAKELYDNHIIDKYEPNYEYISDEKHLKTLNKYYYYELHDLIAIQNMYINELSKSKVKSL